MRYLIVLCLAFLIGSNAGARANSAQQDTELFRSMCPLSTPENRVYPDEQDTSACELLAEDYDREGDGQRAARYYDIACSETFASRPDTPACFRLATLHMEGTAREDFQHSPAGGHAASALFYRICLAGNQEACWRNADLLVSGQDGVRRDLKRAHEIYHLACAEGNDTACQARDRINGY
jgi:TPR repeat protein